MINRLKITSKLTLVFIVFSIVLVVSIGLVNYFSQRALLQRDALENISAIAMEKESALISWLAEQRNLIATISSDPEVFNSTAELLSAEVGSAAAQSAKNELLNQLLPWNREKGHILDLLVMHPVTGEVLAATNSNEDGKFKEHITYYLEGRKGSYIQAGYWSNELQSEAITTSAPIYAADGRLVGVLAGRLKMKDLSQIIQRRSGLRQSDDAFLINTSNLFVTQPRLESDPAILRVGVHSEAARRCLTGESGSTMTADYRGILAMIAFRWLPQYNLCLIAKLNQAEALLPLNELIRLIGLVSILAIGTASGVAFILARKITGPVHAIQTAATCFAQGDLKVRLHETGGDELGALAHELNQMADSLAEKEARLREYANELERNVDERTAALQESEEHYRLLFTQILYGFALHEIICDDTGHPCDYRFLEVNPAFEQLTGLKASAIVGQTAIEALPTTEPYWIEQYGRVALTGESIQFENHSQELSKYYEITAYSPKIGQFAVIFMDVTERRRSEEMLRESEERYRSLFENMINGYAYCQMLFNNDQPQDFIYLKVNNIFEKLTGLKDVEGKRVSEVIPGIQESNSELMEIYGRVARTGTAEEFETYVEGLGIWFSISVYNSGKDTFVAIFDNITVRKHAEEALAKSHAQLLRGEQIGQHGSWEWDIPNDQIVWSDGLYQVFGLAPQEFGATYEAFLERIHPDDRAYVQLVIETAFHECGTFEFENRIVLPDGRMRNLFTRGELLTGDNNKPARMVGVAMDITERKQVEEALMRSEEQYRELIEQAADGIFISDNTGKYVAINSKGCAMLGYTLEELLAKNLSDLVPIQEKGQNPLRPDDLRAGKPVTSERLMICKNGSLLPVEISGKRLADGRFQGIVRDITDRKRAEDALNNYSRRLAVINRLDHVISSSLNLDIVYDAFVAEMKELVAFDSTAIVLFDQASENWQIIRQWTLGEPAFQPNVWHPIQGLASEWVAQHQQAYLEEILGEQTQWPEHQGLRKEGLQSRVLLPLIIQGKVTGLLTLASQKPKAYKQTDLELLQTLADQLAIAVQNANLYEQAQLTAEELEQRVQARTAQLEKANKDLESFSYSVSHDLRTPLRAINGFAQILTEFHKETLDEEGQHYLDNVVEASNRMGILIDDLLRYSRVGRLSVRNQPVLLDDLFTRILADHAPRIAETGAIIELPSTEINPRILSDATILGQVFSNIIGNALTYHRPEINPIIRVTYQAEAEHHLFGIADNGIGILPEYLEKIFNVFQRLHSSEEYPGTGIGLAIVKKSAELLGGQVWAESTVGAGSTFWLQIPKE